ncbi:unnamed protein product [Linum trigynum]|uniref:Transposase n=1 Tax=Linum trigynum TaxID=586398 RepID=A0AAV2ESH0_9ROSI
MTSDEDVQLPLRSTNKRRRHRIGGNESTAENPPPPTTVEATKGKRRVAEPAAAAADSKKNGTKSPLKNQRMLCKRDTGGENGEMMQLGGLQPCSDAERMKILSDWKFDQTEARILLAEMIILDSLPFRYVEREGFRTFMARACPMFEIPSWKIVRQDCFRLFLEERYKLKEYFADNASGRVSISTNRWTCAQNYNYMSVTAHFVGKDWKLHRRVISFFRITSRKGWDIGGQIASCLEEWGLKSVFSITVDNANVRDDAVSYLRDKLVTWGSSIRYGTYLHTRCVSHIINLIVTDGLEEIGISVSRVREAVRWTLALPSRYAKFKEFVALHNIETKRKLCLDEPNRWDSTCFMLMAAVIFEKPFESLERSDPNFRSDLEAQRYKDEPMGPPTPTDWNNARNLCKYLKKFYEFTLLVSEASYVTSHLFLREFGKMFHYSYTMESSEDGEVRIMASKMHNRVAKYWSEKDDINARMNRLFYIAVVLDPRHKMEYPKYILRKLYGEARGDQLAEELKEELVELFEHYQRMLMPANQRTKSYVAMEIPKVDVRKQTGGFNDSYDESRDDVYRTELETYLAEFREPNGTLPQEFDILRWWMIYAVRYPILSEMAKDILAVPISTASSSKSPFDTEGQVLDSFKSSLTPKIMEALICSEDWLRSSNYSSPLSKDDYEDPEELENAFQSMVRTVNASILGEEDEESDSDSSQENEASSSD